MGRSNRQISMWKGSFGRRYTTRNDLTLSRLDNMYRHNYGITRTELNKIFIGKLGKNIKILEVGSNIGNQLLLLQKLGFKNLYGIDVNKRALQICRARNKDFHVIEGSAFDIPFKDGYFDLVFTSGVLIHISPDNIEKVICEIFRCSKKYIWGFEYYADKYTEVIYRGEKKLLWKTDFIKLFFKDCRGIRLIKEKRLKYLTNKNIDSMYLFKKL